MTKTNQDIPDRRTDEFVAGDTLVIDTPVEYNGGAYDLTGASITFVIAEDRGETPLVTRSVGNGITITNAVGGEFRVVVDPADTVNLCGNYHIETEVVVSDGRVSTVSTGQLHVKEDTA
jgi:hypothetical protein